MLTVYKNKYFHYYVDVQGRYQGECKRWYDNGQLEVHHFYKDNKDITKEVIALVDDISNITQEEKLLIKLKFGIECLC